MTDAIIAAGQRIMTGLAGTKTDRGFINAVKQYKIGNYILFHVVCLKMESLQKYIIPAILENRRVDFIPIRHPTIILL